MPSLEGLAAPLALMLPMLGAGSLVVDSDVLPDPVAVHSPIVHSSTGVTPIAHSPEASRADLEGRWSRLPVGAQGRVSLDALLDTLRTRQIRIEQRVIVRIAPQRGGNRSNLLAQLPQRALNTRFEERETGECVAVEDIAGVQTGSGNRLLLYLRDRQIMSLNLEKACRARDFYSGFYIERSEDGKVCINRDELQSRNGARCEIDRMMELVAVSE